MKNTGLFFLLSLALFSCRNLEKSENRKIRNAIVEKLPADSAGNLDAKQKIISDAVDTIASAGGYDLKYVQDPVVTKELTPYFVKDFCSPGDYQHPMYTAFKEKGASLTSEVIKKLKVHKNSVGKLEKTLGSINGLQDCKLTFIPLYYLSPNVVQFKNGERLKKYFHLDTTAYNYRLLKGDKLVGIVTYNEPALNLKLLLSSDSLSYRKILSLQKDPILIGDGIRISAINTSIPIRFGYVTQDNLIYSKCRAGSRSTYAPGTKDIPPPIPYEECETQSIEKYYDNPGVIPSMLTHVIRDSYSKLVALGSRKK